MTHLLDSTRLVLLGALAAALASPLGGCGGEEDLGGTGNGGNVGFGGASDVGQFRDLLERGEIPGPETFDAAGFFAEHHVELPPAGCGGTVCPHAMLAVGTDWVRNDYQAVVEMGLTTPIDPASLEPRPLDLVVVVDVSGSMSEDDRIGYLRQGLHLLVDQLGDDDRLALVTYSNGATVRSPLAAPDRPALHALIDGLVAGGATNLHEGLSRGFAELGDVDLSRQARVLLLSDGLATSGVTDPYAIRELAIERVHDGVGLSTIGVGDDFDVALMRGLAEVGAGNFYYLESPDAVVEVFGEELAYSTHPIALDVELELVTAEAYHPTEIAGPPRSGIGEHAVVRLPAVFVASRTDVEPGEGDGRRGGGGSIFVDLNAVGGSDRWGGARIGVLMVRYREPGGDAIHEEQIAIDNPFVPGELPGEPEEIYVSHAAMAKQHAMYNVFSGLWRASEDATYDYHCSLDVLERLRARTAAWNREAADPDIAADLELIDGFAANLRARGADASYCGSYDEYPAPAYGCANASGSGAGGLALLAIAGLIVLRRRRR